MKFSRFSLLKLLYGTLFVVSYPTFVNGMMKGIQTGPSHGSAYASHMLYDPGTATVFMVGNTYDPNNLIANAAASGSTSSSSTTTNYSQRSQANPESSCFVTSVDLDYFDDGWEHFSSLGGNSNILESCHGLAMINPTSLLVLGNSETGGLYYNDNNNGNGNNSKMNGFAMSIEKTDFVVSGGVSIVPRTTTTSSSSRIFYPISAATNGEEDMYIVSLTSTNDEISASSSGEMSRSAFPNWIGIEKYGTSFEMSISKVSLQQEDSVLGIPDGPSTLTHIWTREYPIDPDLNGIYLRRAYLAGILYKNKSFLVVAGSTNGFGEVYGAACEGDSDEDGYIAFLNPSTGELLQGQKNQERIGTDDDDYIFGICDNPNDPESFYVVGATKGDIDHGVEDALLPKVPGSLQPFLKKVSVSEIHGIWTVQWAAIKGESVTSSIALGCAVSGDTVYVAGNVENGAGMVNGYDFKESKGGDDIWVARVTDSGEDYTVNWMQQIGTAGDDHVARYGGIVTDSDGNAVVYGDTTGSMFREKGSNEDGNNNVSDVFMMVLDKEYSPTQGSSSNDGGGVASFPGSAPYGTTPVANSNALRNFEGAQSGRSVGNTYASSMMYDIVTDTIFLVGNTYDPIFGTSETFRSHEATSQSNCFVASVSLIGSSSSSLSKSSVVLDQGEADLESCRGIGDMTGTGSLVVLGNSEPDGMFAHMTGFVAPLNKNSFESVVPPLSLSMSDPYKIPYPISSVPDPSSSSIYVLAISSTDSFSSAQYDRAMSSPYPNWIEYEKYGASFEMTVMKISSSTTTTTTLSQEWRHEFAVDAEYNGKIPRVFLGDMILKNNTFLIAAGSTRGSGDGYGGADGDDEDGFVTLIDINNGNLVKNQRNQQRIGTDEDDIITAICDNPNDPNSFYVVGATKGDIGGIQEDQLEIKEYTLQAFVMKLNVRTLQAIWTKQWGAIRNNDASLDTATFAMDCAVTNDNIVYVAGNVKNEAGVVQGYKIQKPQGGDDIWVAQITDHGNDYNVDWLYQVGTSGEDHLAPNGGIIVDRVGNAIIYGQTTGSMFRERDVINDNDNQSDVFVMSFQKNTGKHATQNPDENDHPSFFKPKVSGTGKSLDPTATTFIIFVVLLCFMIGICWFVKRRIYGREATTSEDAFEESVLMNRQGDII